MNITAEQLRAARGLLRLEQVPLADLAKVSAETVRRFESQTGTIRGRGDTLAAITAALESAGVEFILASEQSGPGVRLRIAPADPFRAFVERVANAERGDDLAYFIEEARQLLA